MANKPGRPGAVRKKSRGPAVGSGGQGRQALEGRGPTPKAEDRPYHPAGKRKIAQDKLASKRGGRPGGAGSSSYSGGSQSGERDRDRTVAPRNQAGPGRFKGNEEFDLVNGRNAVLEAMRTKIPATTLYLAQHIEIDDRVREALKLANIQNIAIVEVTRQELDRMAGFGEVHQGLALKVPKYSYVHPEDLLAFAKRQSAAPLIVAVDGVTDPRNLGAIIRSVAAFGGHGVIIPGRRSVGVTPAAWKTSAGAAARIPVASVGNLTQALKKLQQQGVFVLGLDGGGNEQLPGLRFAKDPIVLVVGSEGKGLSRLVTETCDAIVSVPISKATESLNAGIATSVALYEIAKLRAA
ncbi:MAG: 23S rRNA (guanosine(2251)-2'-O)-methyltransferase RlmB [Microbacteriaceae bacterium]